MAKNFTHTKILLLGPQHVGKSTVGLQIIQHVDAREVLKFYDSDELMLAAYNLISVNTHTHQSDTQSSATPSTTQSPVTSIRELYSILGEKEFRTLEGQQIAALVAPFVCATGGGFANNQTLLATLDSSYKKILLTSNADIVWPRVIKNGIPSYLSNLSLNKATPQELQKIQSKFTEIFNQRTQIYKKYADFVIDTTYLTPLQIAEEIINHL